MGGLHTATDCATIKKILPSVVQNLGSVAEDGDGRATTSKEREEEQETGELG